MHKSLSERFLEVINAIISSGVRFCKFELQQVESSRESQIKKEIHMQEVRIDSRSYPSIQERFVTALTERKKNHCKSCLPESRNYIPG